MHLVKKKAKAEMALLEQELLTVIQAMEEATLSDNVAVALSEVLEYACCCVCVKKEDAWTQTSIVLQGWFDWRHVYFCLYRCSPLLTFSNHFLETQGIVSPQELETLEYGLMNHVAHENRFKTPHSPVYTPKGLDPRRRIHQRTLDTDSTQPAQRSSTFQGHVHPEPGLDLDNLPNVDGTPSDGLYRERFLEVPEDCDQLVNLAPVVAISQRQRKESKQEPIEADGRNKAFRISNSDKQEERQVVALLVCRTRENRLTSNDACHSIGQEIRAEITEQVSMGRPASSLSVGNHQTHIICAELMPLEQFLNCLDSLKEPGNEVTIIACMKQHMTSIEAVQRGCEALLVLTPNLEGEKLEQVQQSHSDWKRVLEEMQARYFDLGMCGTAEVVIRAMTEHESCANISATGCRILLLLARNECIRRNVVENDGISAIMRCGNKNLYYGCLCLCIPVSYSPYDRMGVDLRAMDRHTCVPAVQEYGCGALRNLALNCVQASSAIAGNSVFSG